MGSTKYPPAACQRHECNICAKFQKCFWGRDPVNIKTPMQKIYSNLGVQGSYAISFSIFSFQTSQCHLRSLYTNMHYHCEVSNSAVGSLFCLDDCQLQCLSLWKAHRNNFCTLCHNLGRGISIISSMTIASEFRAMKKSPKPACLSLRFCLVLYCPQVCLLSLNQQQAYVIKSWTVTNASKESWLCQSK